MPYYVRVRINIKKYAFPELLLKKLSKIVNWNFCKSGYRWFNSGYKIIFFYISVDFDGLNKPLILLMDQNNLIVLLRTDQILVMKKDSN